MRGKRCYQITSASNYVDLLTCRKESFSVIFCLLCCEPGYSSFERETLCSFSENELLFWREMKVNFCHYVLSSEALKVHSSAPCFRWRRPRPKLVGVR